MPEGAAPKACVIGWPIGHSRSPLIHGHWLKVHGIAGAYEKRQVPPEDLRDFLLSLEAQGYRGCNVTIPHKEQAFRIVSQENPYGLTPVARRLKAVNTIWLEEGRLHADNTDVHGFMANFRQSLPHWSPQGKRVVVLGAGGAARAVVAGFSDAGVKSVAVVNRTVEKAEDIAHELASDIPVSAHGLADLEAQLAAVDVLVNATSLGMTGQPPLDIDLSPLPEQAVVADIVYVPLRTALLEQAAARGLKVVEGLGMLLHQAVPGFEKWFGPRPRVDDELRRIIEADVLSC